MSEDSRQNYIFWVFGWANNPHQMFSDLSKCEINKDFVKIYSEPILEIPVASIHDCAQVNSGSSYNMRGYVKLTLENRKDIYLIPANPLNPSDGVYSVNGEVHDMIRVIKGFISGETISLDTNPYVRSLKRVNRDSEIHIKEWDANTLPSEYFPKKKTSFKQFTFSTIAGFLFVILILLVVLALLGQIHIHLQR